MKPDLFFGVFIILTYNFLIFREWIKNNVIYERIIVLKKCATKFIIFYTYLNEIKAGFLDIS